MARTANSRNSRCSTPSGWIPCSSIWWIWARAGFRRCRSSGIPARRSRVASACSICTRRGEPYSATPDGSDGELSECEVLYTFGLAPMQQYLVDLGQGRLQALSIVWDTRPAKQGGQRWFQLYPDDEIGHGDPLHWTGAAQNWNFMCADCHVTDYRKGFDADKGSFSPAWSELGVGCEACHGPGSQHLAWAEGEHGLADR